MSLSHEAALAKQIQAIRGETAQKLLDMGVPESRIEGLLSFGAVAAACADGSVLDADLSAFAPDKRNDQAAALETVLKSDKAITLDIIQPLTDGRTERMRLGAREARAYLRADVQTRELTRLRKTRERHVTTARKAAAKLLRETNGVLRDGVLSHDERLCLAEYGVLREGRVRVAREAGAGYERALRVRENALRVLDRFVRLGGASPREVREGWGDPVGGYHDPEIETPARRHPLFTGALDVDGNGIESYYEQWGPQVREMLLNDVWDEQAKARWAYAHDPMVKFALQTKVAYILGRGFRIEAKDAPKESGDDTKQRGDSSDGTVQGAIDDFFKRHNARMLRRWVLSSHVMGELYLRKLRLGGGRLRVTKLPAGSIWEVVTDTEDRTVPLYYVQRYQPRFQMYGPAAHYVERILPADEIIHFKINDDEDETRGRSEAYSSMPWHRRIRDVADAMVEREYVKNAYTHYAKINGNQSDIDAFLRAMPQGRPRPNTYLAFNTKVEEFGMTGGSGSDSGGRTGPGTVIELLQIVAAWGYGLPKDYFGITSNRTRGGAVVSEGPIQKLLESRQEDIDDDLATPLVEWIIDEGKAGGLIRSGAAEDYAVIFPEIIKGDSDTKIKNLVVGRAQGWSSNRTAGNIWAAEMDIDDYDYDDERDAIDDEAGDGITLPGLPKDEDKGEDQPGAATPPPAQKGGAGGVGGGTADRTQAPNPQTARGANAIRKDDRSANEARIEEAAALISASGGLVLLP